MDHLLPFLTGLIVPYYMMFKSRLKSPFHSKLYWAYYGCISLLWFVHLWHGSLQDLSDKQNNLSPRAIYLLGQPIHLLWTEAGAFVLLMALPLIWNLRDIRKMQTQSVEQQ